MTIERAFTELVFRGASRTEVARFSCAPARQPVEPTCSQGLVLPFASSSADDDPYGALQKGPRLRRASPPAEGRRKAAEVKGRRHDFWVQRFWNRPYAVGGTIPNALEF